MNSLSNAATTTDDGIPQKWRSGLTTDQTQIPIRLQHGLVNLNPMAYISLRKDVRNMTIVCVLPLKSAAGNYFFERELFENHMGELPNELSTTRKPKSTIPGLMTWCRALSVSLPSQLRSNKKGVLGEFVFCGEFVYWTIISGILW